MEMFDLRQVIPTKKSTSPVTEYLLEITTTDHDTGLPKVFRYTDLHHPDKDIPLASMMNIIVDNPAESRKRQRTNW